MEIILITFVGNYALRICDFFFGGGGGGYVTLINRWRSEKTEGKIGPKNKGGSLAVGTYLQRTSAPLLPNLKTLQ